MGILKHVILPAFGLLNINAALSCRNFSSWAKLLLQDPETDDDKKSAAVKHTLGSIQGFSLAMAFLCAWGSLKGDAEFRKVVVMAECITCSVSAYDAFGLGLNYFVPAGFALLGAAGRVVSGMEPGIFTKDKRA